VAITNENELYQILAKKKKPGLPSLTERFLGLGGTNKAGCKYWIGSSFDEQNFFARTTGSDLAKGL